MYFIWLVFHDLGLDSGIWVYWGLLRLCLYAGPTASRLALVWYCCLQICAWGKGGWSSDVFLTLPFPFLYVLTFYLFPPLPRFFFFLQFTAKERATKSSYWKCLLRTANFQWKVMSPKRSIPSRIQYSSLQGI